VVTLLLLDSALGAAVDASVALSALVCASNLEYGLVLNHIEGWVDRTHISTGSTGGTVVVYLPDHGRSHLSLGLYSSPARQGVYYSHLNFGVASFLQLFPKID
jgi:hypothetical protein